MIESAISEILSKFGFILSLILKRDENGIVAKINNELLGDCVIKFRIKNTEGIKRELEFLNSLKNKRFKYLIFPEIKFSGDNWYITNYINREFFEFDTISKKAWDEGQILLWVNAFIEYQNIKRNPSRLPLKRAIKENYYNLILAVTLLLRFKIRFNFLQYIKIIGLLMAYSIAQLFTKKVNTHFDFQTHNVAFTNNRQKISILDFEALYTYNDPFYDLIYYCSISPIPVAEWDYQLLLVSSYIKIKCLKLDWLVKKRIQFIVFVTQLSRFYKFYGSGFNNVIEVYKDNVKESLNLRFYKNNFYVRTKPK